MKNLTVTLFQDAASYSFAAEVSNESLNVYCGTALNHFFTYVSTCKKVGARAFKHSLPINLKIEVEGLVFNTGTCDIKLQSKLKLQRTSDGMKRFALRAFEIIKFSTVQPVEANMSDLLESL